ncbi:MAG: AraC family transcriptional regulator [Chitinophagaceae bacterium]|nr:AraC family transcriptional regulator [Chitinophagaceae bacterium]
MKLYIKYMACESCKVVVREALKELEFTAIRVELGEIETKETLSDEDKTALNKKIKKPGLEILENKTGLLLEKIKQVMVDYVYHSDEKSLYSFSDLISKELNYSYGYLANFFSEVEATTIEKYIIAMKIERVKEFLSIFMVITAELN